MSDLPAYARDEIERSAAEWSINVELERLENDGTTVLRATSYTPLNDAYRFELEFPPDDDRTEIDVRIAASKQTRGLIETVLNHLTSGRRPEPGEWGRPAMPR